MPKSSLNRFLTELSLSAMLFLAALPGHAQSSASDFRYLFTEKEAVLLLPPDLIAAPHVVGMTWSPDSQRVVAVGVRQSIPTPARPEPPAEMSLIIWNSSTQHSQEAWKKSFESGFSTQDPLQWLPNTSTVLQEIHWIEKGMQPGPDNKPVPTIFQRQSLLWIDSQRGFVREIPETAGDQVFVSPTRAYTVVVHGWPNFAPDQTLTLTPIRADGVISPTVTLPKSLPLNNVIWSQDGSRLCLMSLERTPDNKKVIPHWAAFDPQSGTLSPLEKAPAGYKPVPPPTGSLQLKVTTLKVQEGETVLHLPALWLETKEKSEAPRTLISADAISGVLAPNGNAVLYVSQGAAWVTRMLRVPKDEFKAAQIRTQRTIVISNGKQLGLGVIMWAMDHDETLPSPDNISAEIGPYIKNESLLEGFNYTYKGGPIGDIAEPANTVLGTVEGPGGVAVIYADGHVKWKNM